MSAAALRPTVPKEQREKCLFSSSTDICLEEEERTFFHLQEDTVIEETAVSLKEKCRHHFGHRYKLGEVTLVHLRMFYLFL